MKVPAEKNSRSFSKNSGCLAKICIKVKLKTSATKRKDLFIKRGLLAMITIIDGHNHRLNTADDLKYLPNPECREKFFKYFSDGMSVPESHRYHKKTVKLNHESAEGGLANGSIIPSRRTVQYWHEVWRLQNHSQKSGSIVIEEAGSSQNADDVEEEMKVKSSGSDSDSDVDYKPLLDVMTGNIKENGAGSSKDADDIDEGASTSKLPEVDGGSLNPNRPVLSLKCLHEDTDDEGSSSKMEEDDSSSKFIDVNDVPELPLNDKDEHQVDDVLKPESDAEEHPNLEPVVKKLLAMRPIVPKPPAIEPVVQKPPAIEPVVQKPPAMEPVVQKPLAMEPVVQKPPAMILIPVVNISAQTPVIPLRTSHEGVYNFRIKIDCSSAPKRSDCAVFSESRNKLYVCKDVPFIVYVSANNVPEGSMICVQAVFSRPEHACASVTRCPTHAQQDYARGCPAYEHFVQCMNDGAIYEKNLKNSKMSVSVPYVEPPDGEAFSSYLFKLTCFNSCVGGINRRPFFLVFTLERNKFMLGRQTIEAKVCACPSRDCKSEDDKEGRRTQNDAQVVSQQDVVAKATVNIQPRPAVNSQPRPTGSSQPRPAGSSQPLGRSQSSGPQKPKYTITVKDRETFEFLQHMKVLYEMNVDPMIPDT